MDPVLNSDFDPVLFALIAFSYLQLAREYLRRKRKNRRFWVKRHIQERMRLQFGAYNSLFLHFRASDHEEFFEFTRMIPRQFEKLHNMIKHKIEKGVGVRNPLPSRLRLALTLCFLAHGPGASITAWFFRVGKSTVYQSLLEVCTALWDFLSPIYLNKKSAEEWYEFAVDYEKFWYFAHCVGAIDGKHIRIVAPPRSGSAFFNYKHFHSFLLMAACDAKYRFTFVDVGDFGSLNDSSVLGHSVFGQLLATNRLPLPKPDTLPNSDSIVGYFFLVDEGLPNTSGTMRPFSRRLNLTDRQRIFNCRHASARNTIENSFGILSARWKILDRPLNFKLSTSVMVVNALTCLHNFIITEELVESQANRRYAPSQLTNQLDENGIILPGQWRQLNDDIIVQSSPCMP